MWSSDRHSLLIRNLSGSNSTLLGVLTRARNGFPSAGSGENESTSIIETPFVGDCCRRRHRCHDVGNVDQEPTKTPYC